MNLPSLKSTGTLALALLIAAPAAVRAEKGAASASAWESSIVTLEISGKQNDYLQPWSSHDRKLQKTGLVIGERSILTTADQLYDRTLIRLQKGGRGQWVIGDVTWLDYYANLALITTSDAGFWRGLKPAALGGLRSAKDTLQILHWREGTLENRRAEFTQFKVREGQLAPVSHVALEVASEIQGAGWGEPVVADSHVVGLVTAQDGRTSITMPASFIQSVLEARKKGTYRGLGFFHFYWQPTQNTATLARLKLPGDPRGVLVINVPKRPDQWPDVLKREDIILRIEGFDLDIQGDYKDPEFGHAMLEKLATRNKWAVDEVRIQIWRDGKLMDVTYRLPKFEYTNSLVPAAVFDQEPDYLMVGGLVFQPLNDPFLQIWGPEWRRRAPFRLFYYRSQPPTPERPAQVLLTQVLPDPYNIGYQEQRCLVVDKVNGVPISRLADMRRALAKPVNGFHIIEFVESDSLRRMVLAAGQDEKAATARVLGRYEIQQAARLASDTRK
jgi:hypothetical protein